MDEDITGLGVGIGVLLFLGVISLAIYFLPWFIALGRHCRNTVAIFCLNLFLGWTLLGWVGALIWACVDDGPQPVPIVKPTTEKIAVYNSGPKSSAVDDMAKIVEMKEKGLITEEEFQKMKQRIINKC